MKRILLTAAVVAIVATAAQAQIGMTITKSLSADQANLGDILTVTLAVENATADAVIVQDALPDALKYVPPTFAVDDGGGAVAVVPTVVGNTLSTTVAPGTYTITFDVQVVEAPAAEETVTNTATATDVAGNVVAAAADVDIQPYGGLSKVVLLCTNDPWYEVPIYTDVHWLLLISVKNIEDDNIAVMTDAMVKDNFAGDLELDGAATKKFINPPPTSGTVTTKDKGKTAKIQLTWDDLDDIADAGVERLWLEVSTDSNNGQGKKSEGKNEYTEPGEHYLNSGATLKFIDSEGTGFQLSAHTPPLMVTAVGEETE